MPRVIEQGYVLAAWQVEVKASAASSLQPPPGTVAMQRVGQHHQLLVLAAVSAWLVMPASK
jgi:hypothetical protein